MPATILFILKALEGRGAERMVTTLASAYVRMGHSVHILCLENTQDMSLGAEIHYHVVPYDKVFSLKILRQFPPNQRTIELLLSGLIVMC
ncbi:hypothetical protein Psyaliredsea_13820 [Psychrobacter alimentarius]